MVSVSYEANPDFKETLPLSERPSKSKDGHFQPTVTSFPKVMSSGFYKHLKLPLNRHTLKVGMTSSAYVVVQNQDS